MMTLWGYHSFFFPVDCSIIEDKIIDLEEIPHNIVPLQFYDKIGQAYYVRYRAPFFKDYQPVGNFYMERINKSDIYGHLDGTKLWVKKDDAIMLKLML